jgi:hypothetical protein
MRHVATGVIMLTLIPIAARGQTPTPSLFRADATTSIGWFTANRVEADNCCANWSSSLFKGIGGGYYWTDHLKSEIEVAWPGPTQAFTYPGSRPFVDGSTLVYEEHTYRGMKLSGSQLFQFGRNAMFHPYAGIGVDVDRDRDEIVRTTQNGRALTQIQLTEHEVHARPFVTTGFKAYFSERAFFRSEIKVAFSDRVEQVIWKSGLGVDFGKSSAPVTSARSERARRAAAAQPREPEASVGYARDEARDRARDNPELWRAYATKLPIGSTLRIAAGRDHLVASLLAVDDTGILVKPKTRVPEPARHLSFDALDELELYTEGTPADRAGAIIAGVGSGAGTFFLLLLALISQID